MSSVQPRLDVDAWFELAERDPAEFESLRQRTIEEFVASAPPRLQQRLRCLQWRIDQERRLAATPLAACIKMSNMMWEYVTGPQGLLEAIGRLQELPRVTPSPSDSVVIRFPSPPGRR